MDRIEARAVTRSGGAGFDMPVTGNTVEKQRKLISKSL